QVDEQFYLFLSNFLELHPRFKAGSDKSRPIFFTGESHAGHYIPSMTAYILAKNEAAGEGELVVDVQGMMIGNGWFDPISQYDVSDFAFGMGLIDSGQRRGLKKQEETCLSSIEAGNYNDHRCLGLMDSVIAASNARKVGVPRVSMYDVRDYELGRQFPPGHATVEAYLNRKDVRAAIHASSCPIKFQECTDQPFVHLSKWDGLGVTKELRSNLNAGVRSLFFNGQYDLICNHVGNLKALERLGDWTGDKEWESARRGVWLSDDKEEGHWGHRRPIGYVKEKRGNPLTFLLVLNSGHMVPLDQPRAALDMLKRFLSGDAFSDGEQALVSVGPCDPGDEDCDDAGFPADFHPAVELVPGTGGGGVTPPAPRVVGTPVVRRDSAVVEFVPGDEQDGAGGASLAATGGGGGGEAAVVSFEARSSPDGLVGTGPASPVVVEGLTPGRTYTFAVTAVYAEAGAAAGEGGEARSVPSVGSPAVTPGCGQDGGGACGGRGTCREGGHEGICVCENGYGGDVCDVLLAAGGGLKGGGGGSSGGSFVGPDGYDGDIKLLLEEDIPMLKSAETTKCNGCGVGIQFLLRPGSFRDPEFVLAIRTPRVLPPSEVNTENGGIIPSSSIAALDEQGAAFSALLRSDGRNVKSSQMLVVSLVGV
ncbi:unnamed protein product, partial [Ectocarpus sp. 13 AM-2016]